MPGSVAGFSRKALLFSAVLIAAAALFFTPGSRAGENELLNSKCLKCHSEFEKMDQVLAGDFESLSNKAKSFQVDIGEKIQIVKFTPETQVVNVEEIKKLQKPIPVLVTYKQEGADLVATSIKAKPVIKVSEEQLMTAEDIENMLKKPGSYALLDSRPPINYQEGHIPTAVSMPFGKMPSMMDKLPEDKSTLVVFYCGGFRWVLSPMAARLAEKNGYTNVKVYHAGMPDWAEKGNPVLTTSQFVNDRMGYIVIIDTRGVEEAKKGYIQGAVAIKLDQIVNEKDQFPLDRKAYIVFYSDKTDLDKIAPVVKEVSTWGYKRLFTLDGGYEGWLASNGPIQKDMVRTKIFYLPRPHPGEITGDEFMNIVNNQPPNKQILDVRTETEVSGGMLPGAVNIPVDQLQARLNELPKDKEIITHCRTGLRAEMAYNILRNAKINARFLNDKVELLEGKVFCCFK